MPNQTQRKMGKWTCTGIQLRSLLPQGVNNEYMQFGHTFMLDFQLHHQPDKKSKFRRPHLEWDEVIVEFDYLEDAWEQISCREKNIYELKPESNAFDGWNNMLKEAPLRVPEIGKHAESWNAETVNEYEDASISYLKSNAVTIPAYIVYTSMLNKGFKEQHTFRRITYFDIGIEGQANTRFKATQILEVTNGNITIQKFLVPGVAENSIYEEDTRLETWRTDFKDARLNKIVDGISLGDL